MKLADGTFSVFSGFPFNPKTEVRNPKSRYPKSALQTKLERFYRRWPTPVRPSDFKLLSGFGDSAFGFRV